MAVSKYIVKEIERLKEKLDYHQIWKEFNQGLYVKAFLEDDYLYHTTSFKRLQKILKVGFLSSDPKHTGHNHLHEEMICFTTDPLRHLSNMQELSLMLGYVELDTYIKFPFDYLKERGVRPVFYAVDNHELRKLSEFTPHWLQRLTTEEQLRREYGDLFDDYRYKTWIHENEWRIKAEKLYIPEKAEIYVSSYYQRRKIQSLTDLPVFLWRDVMKLKEEFRKRRKKEIEYWRRNAEMEERFLNDLLNNKEWYLESYGEKAYQEFVRDQIRTVNYCRRRAKLPLLEIQI